MSGSNESQAEILTSLNNSEALKPKHDFVALGLAGAPASGKGMWAGAAELRKRLGDDFIYEESISTPAAFAGERAKTERFTRIANEAATKLGDRKELLIIAHSMGGAEALMFLDKASADERFRDKKIDLVVFSPVGYGAEGWKGVWGWLEGTKRILENRDLFESHIACPLPYEVAKEISPLMTETEGFEETTTKDDRRDQRRQLFEEVLRRVKTPEYANTVLAAINWRDTLLTEEVSKGRKPSKILLEERAKLIAPYIGALLDAEHLDPESQRLLSDIYKLDKGPVLLNYLKPSFLKSLSPYVRQMFNMSYEGFTKVLRNLKARLEQRDIALNTHLVYMRNDKFVTPEQAKQALQEIKVDDIASIWALADVTHFTAAYQPAVMMDVVEQVTGKKL